MTLSNGNIFRVTGHLCGEFNGHRWIPRTKPSEVTRSFDVFFDLRMNTRLSKQSWGLWFETPPCSLWCHCNGWFPTFSEDVQYMLVTRLIVYGDAVYCIPAQSWQVSQVKNIVVANHIHCPPIVWNHRKSASVLLRSNGAMFFLTSNI